MSSRTRWSTEGERADLAVVAGDGRRSEAGDARQWIARARRSRARRRPPASPSRARSRRRAAGVPAQRSTSAAAAAASSNGSVLELTVVTAREASSRAAGPGLAAVPVARTSDADRMPDGLGLHERQHPRAAWAPRSNRARGASGRRTPLHVRRRGPLELDGESSPGAPARSRASTSRWAASTGASSATRPVSRFTTPPGTSEVAEHLGQGDRRQRPRLAGDDHDAVFPVTITGASTLTSPRSEDACGASTPTTPVGSGTLKLKNGPATGFDDPGNLGHLVGPAGVPDPAVDRGVDRLPRACLSVDPLAGGGPRR